MTDKVDANPAVAALNDLLAMVRRNIELDLRVSAPARVVVYDPATQRATIQLELLPVKFLGDLEVPQPPIPIPGVPVCWTGGSLGYVTTPLVPGDTGLALFSDRCLSLWLLQGGPIDPINGRTHALGDAMFLPGLRNTTNPITPPTDLTATVVEGPLVHLGRLATHPVAFGDLLHTYLTAMFSAATVTALDGGAAFKAALIAYLNANPFSAYASTKVLGE